MHPSEITAWVGFYVNTKSSGIIHVNYIGSLLPKGGRQRETHIRSYIRDGSIFVLTAICKGSQLQAAVSFSARSIRLLGKGQWLGFTTFSSNPSIQKQASFETLYTDSGTMRCGRTLVPEGEVAHHILHPKRVQKDQQWSCFPLQEIFRHHAGCHCNSFFLPPMRTFTHAMPVCL